MSKVRTLFVFNDINMKIRAIKTRVFKENENLADFVFQYIKKLPEKSMLVVTSKIAALSEGRTAPLKDKVKLIKQESQWAKNTKYTYLTIKDKSVMPCAGIDESNGNGRLILLPKDSFAVAKKLRRAALKKFKIKKLGVVITDSRTTPLRAGITGMAVGYAGFKGIKDYRGQKDIFGRVLQVSQVNVADSLATAAVLLMGEGKEQQPLAIIENAPMAFGEKANRAQLNIALKDDMYRPLFWFLTKN